MLHATEAVCIREHDSHPGYRAPFVQFRIVSNLAVLGLAARDVAIESLAAAGAPQDAGQDVRVIGILEFFISKTGVLSFLLRKPPDFFADNGLVKSVVNGITICPYDVRFVAGAAPFHRFAATVSFKS